jgi:seryl-tRNA synthetase
VSQLRPERLPEVAKAGLPGGEAGADDLTPAGWVLPSAACYNIYLHLAGTDLDTARYITTVATCFRNEERYDGLRRLHGFSMREIVGIGTRDEVQDHLRAFKGRVTAFGEQLGLGLTVAAGSDPFYQPQGGRAVLQQLFPQKEELLYDGTLAIASFNFHRNFFGERCCIRAADGQPAFSGCVAFGIERWLHALLARHGNPETAAEALGE